MLSVCRGLKITDVPCNFPCFWAGILLITKRFYVEQLKGGRILAITLLKSTT